jgi:hypothetical protein
VFSSKAACILGSSSPSTCTNFCPEVKCWPGTPDAKAQCVAYYKSKGWQSTDYECDCEEYATINGLDKSLCKSISPQNCPTPYVNYWKSIGIQATSLSTQSPNWCNWRGNGIGECCKEGGDGLWKSDNDSCTMLNGNAFQPDCSGRVTTKLNSLPVCGGYEGFDPNFGRSIVIDISFLLGDDGKVTENHTRAKVVFGEPPNRFRKIGAFNVTTTDENGTETEKFILPFLFDYRLANVSDFEQGMVRGKEGHSSIIIPFDLGAKEVEVSDPETGEVITKIDVSEAVLSFCKENPRDPYCTGAVVEPTAPPTHPENETGGQPPTHPAQTTPPTQQPSSSPDFSIPLLLLGVAAVLGIGAGAYWFFIKK